MDPNSRLRVKQFIRMSFEEFRLLVEKLGPVVPTGITTMFNNSTIAAVYKQVRTYAMGLSLTMS